MVTERLLGSLRNIVGGDGVVSHATELSVYDCDGYTLEKSTPEAVVLPRSTDEVAAVLKLLKAEGVPFVPRGTGTGLSGGCLPLGAPVMVSLTRMNRILELDPANRRAVVESGVVNAWVSRAARPHGLHYVPDPSSQMACSIGGNVAENSGGPHTLKYGVTTNHVLGVTLVLPDGEVVRLGGMTEDAPGYDLVGVTVGSEGTFGIVTEAILKLYPLPQGYKTLLAVFDSVADGSAAVAGIVASGIVPAALEMLDRLIIQAVEDAFHFGFPREAGAVLIVELDGLEAGLEGAAARIREVCESNGATGIRVARDDDEREALWKCRKRPSARWGGWRLISAARTGWCRPTGCRRSWSASLPSAKRTASASATSSTPATATSTRSSSTTSVTGNRPRGWWRRAGRSSGNAWPWAAASPASTASGWRRWR